MKRKRLPLPTHPLTKLFRIASESVTTSLGDSSLTSYRGTVRHFLTYLGAQQPEVHWLHQLRRDPHILGWLALLRSHRPPLATITRANYLIYLRRMLEELAWTGPSSSRLWPICSVVTMFPASSTVCRAL
jgi:hypothetical protein